MGEFESLQVLRRGKFDSSFHENVKFPWVSSPIPLPSWDLTLLGALKLVRRAWFFDSALIEKDFSNSYLFKKPLHISDFVLQ